MTAAAAGVTGRDGAVTDDAVCRHRRRAANVILRRIRRRNEPAAVATPSNCCRPRHDRAEIGEWRPTAVSSAGGSYPDPVLPDHCAVCVLTEGGGGESDHNIGSCCECRFACCTVAVELIVHGMMPFNSSIVLNGRDTASFAL